MELSPQRIKNFQSKIWDYYNLKKRDFPWRNTTELFNILVSEMMLQQTQASRVIDKYNAFVAAIPNFEVLASTPQPEILKLWHGLGYNRRALYLKQAAEIIVQKRAASQKLQFAPEFLQTLPGIGPNTAGAIYVFSHNKPHFFIETNIRRVFIHEFFSENETVSDKQILPLIEQSLPENDCREWYYALMDYGSYLAKSVPNPNRRSRHYSKQSKFEGSLRQTRGKILKLLLNSPQDILHLTDKFKNDSHFQNAIDQLTKENFIVKNGKYIKLRS